MKSLERKKIVLIGASTGGPAHIEKILCALPKPLAYPVIIAQHMGAEFLPSFVQRLALKTQHNIVLVQDNIQLSNDSIYLATHCCSLRRDGDKLKFHLQRSENSRYNPDINHLFSSLKPFAKSYNLLTVLLTGIGDDGVEGCMDLSLEGARCIAESEKSAIVYGMPARAKEKVKDIEVMDLEHIIQTLQNFGER